MPIVEIKTFSGKVLYSSEALSIKECLANAVNDMADLRGADLRGADLQGADLRGAYLQGAYLRGAYLQGAYLRGADLRGADLQGADLQGADLRGAYLQGDIKIQKQPIQIDALTYYVTIWDNHMQIGCEFHSIKDWWKFDMERIDSMDNNATEWWDKWKKPLRNICKAEGRGKK